MHSWKSLSLEKNSRIPSSFLNNRVTNIVVLRVKTFFFPHMKKLISSSYFFYNFFTYFFLIKTILLEQFWFTIKFRTSTEISLIPPSSSHASTPLLSITSTQKNISFLFIKYAYFCVKFSLLCINASLNSVKNYFSHVVFI